MHEPIDVDLFIAQLGDTDAFSDALWGLMEVENPVVNFVDELSDDQYMAEVLDDWSTPDMARERAIDALIQAVTRTPAAEIRETLGAVLDDYRTKSISVDIETIERHLRETDGDL